MKNFFIKSLLFTVILCLGLVGTYFVIRARSGTTATAGDKLTATKWNELATKVTTLETTVSVINSIPAGSIVAFNSSTCPTGRKAANGANSTVDLRGEFVRGWDNGRGVDSGRTLGSSQAASRVAVDFITAAGSYAEVGGYYGGWRIADPGITDLNTENRSSDLNMGTKVVIVDPLSNVYLSTNTKAVRADVRSRNVALLYCVKN